MQIQKVQHLKDALKLKVPKIHGNYLISEKIEGWFVTIAYNTLRGWYFPMSSAERCIPSLRWVADVLNTNSMNPNYPCTIIAEAYIPDMLFPELNGVLNRSVGNCEAKDVVFACHDLLYHSAEPAPAHIRYKHLQQLLSELNVPFLKVLPIIAITEYNYKLWNNFCDTVTAKGGEGIVAKQENSFYSYGKRNADLLKLKLECEVDALAFALEETTGEKGNPSLVLHSKRQNGTIIKTVIAKHSLQEQFRSDRTSVLGKVVCIKGMEEFPDGQIRQPVFGYVRNDKSVGDFE
jgi:hypothetical protein